MGSWYKPTREAQDGIPSLIPHYSLVIVVQVVEPEAPVTNVEDWEQYVDDGGYVIEGEEYIEPTV